MTELTTTINPPEEHSIGRSLWADARRRLWRDKVAMVCFAIIIIYVVIAILAPFVFSGWDQSFDYDKSNAKPSGEFWLGTDIGVFVLGKFAQNPKYSVDQRLLLLKPTLIIDMFPRICMVLIVPTGYQLAVNLEAIHASQYFTMGVWLLSGIWLQAPLEFLLPGLSLLIHSVWVEEEMP